MLVCYADMGKHKYAVICLDIKKKMTLACVHCTSTCIYIVQYNMYARTHIFIMHTGVLCVSCDKIVPGQQIQKPISFQAIIVRTVTGQSCYRSYHYPYTVVKKPSLSLLCIKSSLRCQEGSGGPKITPYLVNKTFSEKATRLTS